jgi:hypothetical protein
MFFSMRAARPAPSWLQNSRYRSSCLAHALKTQYLKVTLESIILHSKFNGNGQVSKLGSHNHGITPYPNQDHCPVLTLTSSRQPFFIPKLSHRNKLVLRSLDGGCSQHHALSAKMFSTPKWKIRSHLQF